MAAGIHSVWIFVVTLTCGPLCVQGQSTATVSIDIKDMVSGEDTSSVDVTTQSIEMVTSGISDLISGENMSIWDVTANSRSPPDFTTSPLIVHRMNDSAILQNIGDDVECNTLHHLAGADICHFVQTTPSCAIDDGFFNYTEYVYCSYPASSLWVGVFTLFLLLLLFFVSLAIAADDFFCPNLVVMAKTLHMSDNVAGVTLLALGNGAPDLFSALAAISSIQNGDAGLAFGALLGAAIFITTAIAGTVSIVKPFRAMKRPLLRDIVFFLGAVFYIFYILYDQQITLAESLGFVALYVFYVIVVIVSRYIYQRQKAAERRRLLDKERQSAETDPTNSHDNPEEVDYNAFQNGPQSHYHIDDVSVVPEVSYAPTANYSTFNDSNDVSGAIARIPGPQPNPSEFELPNEVSQITDNISDSKSETTALITKEENLTNCQKFWKAVNPIDTEAWPELRWYKRIYEIFKAIPLFIMLICVPVVDREIYGHKWNRYLRCINIVFGIFTSLALASTETVTLMIGGVFPVAVIIIVASMLLSLLVFCTSRDDEPPRYHSIFAFMGFIIAVIWIQAIATEIVNILTTMGLVFNISTTILGLTVLAWGNSIGDFIADVAMAKAGFPRTAISACFGGPLFNLLLGIGIPFTILCVQTGPVNIDFTYLLAILCGVTMFSLCSTLIVIPCVKFDFKRGYGIYLLAVYVIFLVSVVVVEIKLNNL